MEHWTVGLVIAASLLNVSPAMARAGDFSNEPRAVSALPGGESAALIALYNATDGAHWTNQDQWLIDGAECTWHGITCSADGAHVIRIELEFNNLGGTLPSDLFSNFASLQFFSVDSNQIGGAIPALAGSTSLQFVDVGTNAFNGSLPSLSGLTNLGYLYAGQNQLTGAIPPLTGLISLNSFEVYGNRLTGSLPSFAGLSNLTYFNVAGNLLTGAIPAKLSALAEMNHFEVSNNRLTGTIPSLTAMTNLSYFYVDGNFLTGAVPPVASPSPLSAATLCPNFLSLAPSANDDAWNHATGLYPDPWWSAFNSRCDILFRDGFAFGF